MKSLFLLIVSIFFISGCSSVPKCLITKETKKIVFNADNSQYSGLQMAFDPISTPGALYIGISSEGNPEDCDYWRIVRVDGKGVVNANHNNQYKWNWTKRITYDYKIPKK